MNLLSDEPKRINLLADDYIPSEPAKQKKYSDLSPDDQKKALEIARQNMVAENPGMPRWAQDMVLSLTPKDDHPMLNAIANDMEAGTNFIPVTAGGLLQGVNTPFQGVASFIPGKIAQDYANADARSYFPKPKSDVEANLQTMGEFGGALSPLTELFTGLKGASAAAGVPKALQNATAIAGTGAIATPGDAGDKAIGAASGLALGAGGKLAGAVASKTAEKVPAILRGLTNEATNDKLAEAVQKPHDILADKADRLYGYVKNQINKRGISTPVSKEYLKKAERLLSDTKGNSLLIKNAKSGDYNALHDLQSQLYKKGTKGLASDDPGVNNLGEEMLDLRDSINDDLNDLLVKNGHGDIASSLKQGRSTHRKIKQTYYNKLIPKGIGKLVNQDIREVPKDATKLFDKNSLPVKNFLKEHPEAVEQIKGINEKKDAHKALGGMLTSGAKLGGIGFLGKTLFDYLI